MPQDFPPQPAQTPSSVSPEQVAVLPRRNSTNSNADALPVFRELPSQDQPGDFRALRDVELDVKIELGRARMRIEDVLSLADGAVIELNRAAADPVDVFVNDRLVARGEVVVLNDRLAVRLTEVASPLQDGNGGAA